MLKGEGLSRRHEEFADYPYLSARKTNIENQLMNVRLPRAYYDDDILQSIPYTVLNEKCSIKFEGQGIAHGTMLEQAYLSVFPIMFLRKSAKVAANIVCSVEVTATLVAGFRGGRLISMMERNRIETEEEKERFLPFLHENYQGFLQTLYGCGMEAVVYTDCGMRDDDGTPIGCVYLIGE